LKNKNCVTSACCSNQKTSADPGTSKPATVQYIHNVRNDLQQLIFDYENESILTSNYSFALLSIVNIDSIIWSFCLRQVWKTVYPIWTKKVNPLCVAVMPSKPWSGIRHIKWNKQHLLHRTASVWTSLIYNIRIQANKQQPKSIWDQFSLYCNL